MNIYITLFLAVTFIFSGVSGFAQVKADSFIPTVFWGNNIDKGIILAAPNAMEIIDSKGVKYGKIIAMEPVLGAYMAPDGNKFAYTTSTGLWFVKFETKENSLIARGFCDLLRWNSDGLSFVFAIYEKKESGPDTAYNIKFFRADSEGKNLKQIYP